jgi:hypothetical protein
MDPNPSREPVGDEDITYRWHDNALYGLRLDVGDPEKQDWRSDLLLDIDFIAEWQCGTSGEHRFRVAPAVLAFHDVTDVALTIDQGDSQGRNAIMEWAIDRVVRERLDRPFAYWRWTLQLGVPSGGRIAFCSTGFTETLKRAPKWVSEQRLPRELRACSAGARPDSGTRRNEARS